MKFIPAVSEASIVKIPLFTERCPAGFPSPAADYTESQVGSLTTAAYHDLRLPL
ncbi:hypothetical protein JRT27AECX_JRT27AEC_05011 [Escherichia coli]|nr:hypothetical protein JRT27AECX_JRT27AEC_05011 [Escherichia coli]